MFIHMIIGTIINGIHIWLSMFVIITVSVSIGLIFAPLGCLVLWKRYVYFGDGLAHASMFAGIVSVMSGLPIFYADCLVAVCLPLSFLNCAVIPVIAQQSV